MEMKVSPQYALIKEDLIKVAKGALIAGAGTIIFYLLEALPSVNFGDKWAPIVVSICAVLANMARKWWNKNTY